jgi:xanthosine utilization system XapX-like protein
MGRAILSVIVGYVAMFAVIFFAFSGLYLVLGQERSFEPGSYDPSLLWNVLSFALGIGAAVLGGIVCSSIAKTAAPPKVLAGLVLVIGLLSAIPVVMEASAPAEARTGDVGNLDAMMKARQPVWVAFANPFVGFVGVLIGARLRRPQPKPTP